ncbi:MAG: TetR/AcrR family transcriptional regulator [Ectothiorhodospiraceae bacterium]|nr:TetR/AcrR family transcriptional regulator [Ectothiorhodospiraceae bacterium]
MTQAAKNSASRRRSDGEQTHAAILDAAMRLGSIEGLGALTLGRLAAELAISKSGLYAHFGSKERLQRETVEAALAVFQREVLQPGFAAPEGLARLNALCEAYLSYIERGVFPGGCFFAQLLAEYDAQVGPIHEEVVRNQGSWLALLEDEAGIAMQRGELRPDADVKQLAFELTAALEAANYLSVLHRDPSQIARGRAAIQAAIARVAVP